MKLFYRKYGQGIPLIILHGLYGASDNWVSFAKSIEDRFEIFLPDQRNHGRSPHSSDHSFAAMSSDLASFMEECSIDRPLIMGHSMGGKTAMYFAAGNPESLKGLIVLDISPRHYMPDDEMNALQLTHQQIIDILHRFPVHKVYSREEADKMLAGDIRSERIRQFLLKNLTRVGPGKFDWKLNIDALRIHIGDLFTGLEPEEVRKHDYPVMFVKGAQSPYITLRDFSLIRACFPGAEIQTIDGAGHWLHAEKPEELKSLLYHFAYKHNILQ